MADVYELGPTSKVKLKAADWNEPIPDDGNSQQYLCCTGQASFSYYLDLVKRQRTKQLDTYSAILP